MTWDWVQPGDPGYPNNFIQTVDMTREQAEELEATLKEAEERGHIEFSDVSPITEKQVMRFEDFEFRRIEAFE